MLPLHLLSPLPQQHPTTRYGLCFPPPHHTCQPPTPTNHTFPLLVPPLPLTPSPFLLPPSTMAPHANMHMHVMPAHHPSLMALSKKNLPTPLPFSFHCVPHTILACLPPHTHARAHAHACTNTTPAVCNSAIRRRRASSGRPGTNSLRLKGRMRMTGGMRGWRKRTTTTLSSAGCARMEGSCCAVTPAPPPTTSTASTLLSPKSLMESGSAPAAR